MGEKAFYILHKELEAIEFIIEYQHILKVVVDKSPILGNLIEIFLDSIIQET